MNVVDMSAETEEYRGSKKEMYSGSKDDSTGQGSRDATTPLEMMMNLSPATTKVEDVLVEDDGRDKDDSAHKKVESEEVKDLVSIHPTKRIHQRMMNEVLMKNNPKTIVAPTRKKARAKRPNTNR